MAHDNFVLFVLVLWQTVCQLLNPVPSWGGGFRKIKKKRAESEVTPLTYFSYIFGDIQPSEVPLLRANIIVEFQ